MEDGKIKLSPSANFTQLNTLEKDKIRAVAVGLDKRTLLEKTIPGAVEAMASTGDVQVPKNIENAVNQFLEEEPPLKNPMLSAEVPAPAEQPASTLPLSTEPVVPEDNMTPVDKVPEVPTAHEIPLPTEPPNPIAQPMPEIPLPVEPTAPVSGTEPMANVPEVATEVMEPVKANVPVQETAPLGPIPTEMPAVPMEDTPQEEADAMDTVNVTEQTAEVPQERTMTDEADDNYIEALEYFNKARELREEADIFEQMAREKLESSIKR